MKFLKKNILLWTIEKGLITYPCPSNLNYFWNFGVLAALCLGVQIFTGILLAMHYVPEANLAFISVEHLMRDVNNGWLLRYVHSNGASMFFLVVYIHIFRSLYYGSFLYPRQFLWSTGVIILLLMIFTAFLGYVLPWGQMSFWAATVITNLASAVPLIGDSIVFWLWGGFAVDNATLNRFFSLHYLLPFIISAIAIVHIIFLHENGSNNPLGISFKIDQIPFNPYFTIKDFLGVCFFSFVFTLFIFFYPNLLGHSDNYISANPLVTPTHIVPEWYFLPFYAMLRLIPDKLLGVIVLLASIIVLLIVPFFFFKKPTTRVFVYHPVYKILFWIFFFNWFVLAWIGGKTIEFPFYEIGQGATFIYFFYFYLLNHIEFFNNFILISFKKFKKNISKNKNNENLQNKNILLKTFKLF